jgi:hypothetical protein
MTGGKQNENDSDQQKSMIDGGVKKADTAIKDTAGVYLKKFGVNLDLDQMEKWICDNPLRTTMIAAASGYILGGGMATRPGVAILALLGRKAAKETATQLVGGMVNARAR